MAIETVGVRKCIVGSVKDSALAFALRAGESWYSTVTIGAKESGVQEQYFLNDFTIQWPNVTTVRADDLNLHCFAPPLGVAMGAIGSASPQRTGS